MKIYYRLSDSGYNKIKPEYINNISCLDNFLTIFSPNDVILVCDNVSDETWEKLHKLYETVVGSILRTNGGSSAAGFRIVFDMALKQDDDEIIYFVEGDFIHRMGSKDALLDAFNIGAAFVTLYNHPDKFIPANNGGNPYVDIDGGYVTKIYKGKFAFWFITDSTVMTFASKVSTLKKCESVIRNYITGTYPRDFAMFNELKSLGFPLLQPLITFSTHGEIAWLADLIGTEYSGLPLEKAWGIIINKLT